MFFSGKSSRWTVGGLTKKDIEKGKEGGIHAIREKKVLIANVKNSIILLLQGKEIGYQLVFAIYIKRVTMIFISSIIKSNHWTQPCSIQILSPSMYTFNDNNNRRWTSWWTWRCRAETRQRIDQEDRDLLTLHHICGIFRGRTIPTSNFSKGEIVPKS